MPKKIDMLEMHDQRSNDQLHQRHKHAIRAAKRQKQTTSHSPKRTRSAARSWKRNQLAPIEDHYEDHWDDPDLLDDRVQIYEKAMAPTKQTSKEYTVQYATNTGDSDLLDSLRKELKIGHKHYRRGKRSVPHTMLTLAIDRGYVECIETVLDNIYSGKIYPTMLEHVCSNGRTALWHACKKGNLDLVRELVERGQANINRCGILIVAAQNGHENIINYLLREGADPNRHIKNYNERALHAASRRNHLNIVKLLLKYGADPTIFDYKKRTPLDYAIHKRHNDIAKILIDHQGGCFPMNEMGFTPFMLATQCNNQYIVDILLSLLPHQQVLDELTLLACRYTIDGVGSKRDQAYSYFEKTLKPLCTTEPCEAYEFVHECQTRDELALIRDNDNTMRNYALILSERILLKNDNVDQIVSLIKKQSSFYRQNESFHRSLQLQLHAYRLIIQTKQKRMKNSKLHKEKLSALVEILFEILQKEEYVPFESITLIWIWILNRIDNKLSNLIFKLLFIVTHLVEMKRINGKEQWVLMSLIRRTINENITMENKYFLFSFCIDQISRGLIGYTLANISVSALSIVQLLIRFGANVDEINSITKATPLHLIARCNDVDNAKPVMRVLLDANAHTDCRDLHDNRPEDLARSLEIKELLYVNRKVSLKCLCARLIYLKGVHYNNYLSSNLIAFIQMHSPNTINPYDQSILCHIMEYPSTEYNTLPRYVSIVDDP